MIKDKLKADIISAMKAKEKTLLLTLRGLNAAIKQYEVDSRKDAEESIVLDIFKKEIKKRRDSIEFAVQNSRDDIVQKEQAEIDIIQAYLPEQYSNEKMQELIKDLIASGSDNMGKIMQALKAEHNGKYEGKLASQIAKTLLG